MKELVELTYFKRSGKYYSDGEYYTSEENMHKIFEEVEQMKESKILPDLIQGHSDFIVLVNVPNHNKNYPQLIL